MIGKIYLLIILVERLTRLLARRRGPGVSGVKVDKRIHLPLIFSIRLAQKENQKLVLNLHLNK